MAMTITSSAFQNGATIPAKHTCSDADVSPALAWTGAPAGTKFFALICDDPDAPVGTWVHWVIYNIPPGTASLTENASKAETLPNGAVQGVNDFRKIGYNGPCPPPGAPHRYFFKLYALDARIALPPRATKAQVEPAMDGHILAKAELMGKFGR